MAATIASRDSKSSQQSSAKTPQADASHKFADLDDGEVLAQAVRKIQQTSAQNFLIVLNDQSARILLDGTTIELLDLFSEDADGFSTRWLNIFRPYQHVDLLRGLAEHYDFSPRLLADMCSTPVSSKPDRVDKHTTHKHLPSWISTSSAASNKQSSSSSHITVSSTSSSISHSYAENIYNLASKIWHLTTLDFGRNYISCGYNVIYNNPMSHDDIRVWNWLVICDDGTVISISEDIFARGAWSTTAMSQTATEIRQNVTAVLQSLSRHCSDPVTPRHCTKLLPIRASLGSTPQEELHREADAPGLLFYYLFEGWQQCSPSSMQELRYGFELEQLRQDMITRPQLKHIDRLHRIAQELSMLKRHYTVYNSLIDRLLAPRPPTAASLQNSKVIEAMHEPSVEPSQLQIMNKESSLGVSLSTATRVRFQRLHDQIDLYALNEIEEYLAQKDSLISLNFNLLTLKESLDVEKLTRITLLLTKATILFLPVSFMTSYFGLQLMGTEYTTTQFWLSFSVILTVSGLLLYLFGVLSGTTQTASMLKVVGRAMRNIVTAAIHRKHDEEKV